MDISSGLQGVNETTCAFRSKSCALLVLLCTEMISYPEELTQPDEAGRQARRAFCRALLIIASISTESYPIARLAASKLVQEISLLSSQYSSLTEGTDVWVGSTLNKWLASKLTSQKAMRTAVTADHICNAAPRVWCRNEPIALRGRDNPQASARSASESPPRLPRAECGQEKKIGNTRL